MARDKIFAVLSLATEEDRKAIEPDYSKPDRQVFKEVAALPIHRDGLLPLMTAFLKGDRNLDLPSWATDWSMTTQIDIALGGGPATVGKYFESGFSRFSEDLETLVARGGIIDALELAFPSPFSDNYAHGRFTNSTVLPEHVESRRALASSIALWRPRLVQLPKNPYGSTTDRLKAFYRTPTSDRLIESTGKPDLQLIRSINNTFSHGEYASSMNALTLANRAALVWSGTVTMWLRNHAFIVTREGYLGLAPYKAQPGDLMCNFVGAPVPCLLRQKRDNSEFTNSSPEQEGYEFIGPAYIHKMVNAKGGVSLANSREFFIV